MIQKKKIISAQNKVKFLDNYKNIYYFSKLNADDKFDEIIGYDLNSDLNKEKFQSKDKFNEFVEPKLSGKEVSIKDNITIIKDGKFTSCKSTNEKEGCPCLLYTSPSPRDRTRSRMPSSA